MGSTSEIREPLLSVDEREPLAPDRSAPSSFMETHAIYSTSNRYGNPNGFGAFIRKALGIYSYKDPNLMNKPRKIPMRVEPKTYLALERTFLNWFSMSVTISTLGTTLLGFSVSNPMPEEPVAGYLTPKVMQLMSCCLLPVGLLILFYSIFVYNERVTALKQKEMRYFEDKLSPLLISFFVILTLTILFVMRLIDFLSVQPY